MGTTSSWKMIVKVVPGRHKDEQRRDRKKRKQHRRRRAPRALNLLGLSLCGRTERPGQMGLLDEEDVGAAEDDDEDDDGA